jgi:hypothetical protein
MKPGELRYRAKVSPLFAGRRRVGVWKWEYTWAYSQNQAWRNFGIRFPYPKFIIETPVLDMNLGNKTGGKDAKSSM